MTTGTTRPAWSDPREEIEYVVVLGNGRLAGRSFASREEAERWAVPAEGDEVREINLVCACDR